MPPCPHTRTHIVPETAQYDALVCVLCRKRLKVIPVTGRRFYHHTQAAAEALPVVDDGMIAEPMGDERLSQ